MADIILHNYPQSPVAEKVRVGFGIKGLSWHSVEIPRLPPKPMLTKLTGGYRRTPVMQIGADIYCDSQCILHELEQRYPSPLFFPARDAGLMRALSRWTDGPFFDLSVKLVLGAAGENLPPDFAEDRGRLYLGPNWADGLKAVNADLPHLTAQLRASLSWMNEALSDGRAFLLGDHPAAIDAQIYHVVWFVRGRWAHGPDVLAEFAHLVAWEERIRAIGHGAVSSLSADDAIAIAAKNTPEPIAHNDTLDPQGLEPGQTVVVSPDVDGGEQPVEGQMVAAAQNRLTVHRHDADIGDVHVHFPRYGYRVSGKT